MEGCVNIDLKNLNIINEGFYCASVLTCTCVLCDKYILFLHKKLEFFSEFCHMDIYKCHL